MAGGAGGAECAVAVILAAGAGRRMGRPKAQIALGGRTLLEHAVAIARSAGCAAITAVVRPGVPLERAPFEGVRMVVNDDPERGMGSSLRLGLLDALAVEPPEVDRAVVLLVDMPSVAPEAVRRVGGALSTRMPLSIAGYLDGRAHPAGFHRAVWRDVADHLLGAGDQGARAYLGAHPRLVTLVDCADLQRPSDIDTPGDLRHASGGLPPGPTASSE